MIFGALSAAIVCLAALAGWQPPSPRSGEPAPTFYKDVLPILENHCQSCHRAGEVAPMPLRYLPTDASLGDGDIACR